MDAKTEVTMWPVADLIPYTNNPKQHPDEQIQKLASSIKNYGWDQPIVVDGNGEIIKGHGRLQAAERLNLTEVPVIERPDLTDAQAKAARIADNKTAESAWDDELLAVELEQIDASFSAEQLGFDGPELDDLLDVSPEFDPVESSDQPDLDTIDTTTDTVCPNCGHEFTG
jgi:ParB/RepB/Spo0J family partition protein